MEEETRAASFERLAHSRTQAPWKFLSFQFGSTFISSLPMSSSIPVLPFVLFLRKTQSQLDYHLLCHYLIRFHAQQTQVFCAGGTPSSTCSDCTLCGGLFAQHFQASRAISLHSGTGGKCAGGRRL